MFYNVLMKEKTLLEQKITIIQKKLNKFPDENLCCAKNGSTYKWYFYADGTQKYIRKKDRKYAEKLALKKYHLLELDDLQNELYAIDNCLLHYPKQKKSALLLEEHTEYQKLLAGSFLLKSKDINDWLSEPYDKNPQHPDNLKFKASNGIFVRSKSELIIANMLISNNIPFRYECGLSLNGMTIYPDFTIMHPKTREIFYWEHFGMIDSPSYASSTTSKLHTYISNKIYPSVSLITTFETKDNPLNISMVEEIIRFYFL